MHNENVLSSSSQDYLEAILELSEHSNAIRPVDLANRIGVSRASITKAIKVLKSSGYIEQQRYSDIYLTPEGKTAAIAVTYRHKVLRTFLIDILGVDPKIADEDACKMEHNISFQTLTKLCEFVDKAKDSSTLVK